MMKRLMNHPFVRFVAKKALFYGFVAFIAITLVFLIPRLMPGNPVDIMIHPGSWNPQSNIDFEEIRNTMMEYFGLDLPLHEQYIIFWGQLFSGNLGRSFMEYPTPVIEIVLYKLPFTLALVIPVLVLSFFLGNWIGAKSAFLKGNKSEFAYILATFTKQLPTYWFGMVLLFLFAVNLAIFPLYGYSGLGTIPSFTIEYFLELLYHYTLPFLSLFIVYLGGWAAGMRSMMIHEMDSGYVRYGRQLGFKEDTLMSYAKRNAMLPQLTGLNLYLQALIGETIALEVIFGWPGIGKSMYDAAMNVDYPLILGCLLVIIIVVLVGNFLIDILYGFIDPRIRTGHRG